MVEKNGQPAGVNDDPCTCAILRKATRHITRIFDEVLAPTGLRTTQRTILALVDRLEPMTLGGLSTELVMDRSALGRTLKPLVRDGFVSVVVGAEDRRSRHIMLTSSGRAKLAQTDALWARAHAGFENSFGAVQSEALRETMLMLISQAFTADLKKNVAGPH